MSKKTFYITTTLPYVNAEPHIGFAMEIVRADIIARYKYLSGYEVFFNTGTDEHGSKVWNKALEAGEDIYSYTAKHAENFKALKELLNLSYNSFVRTTDDKHKKAAQEFWKRCDKAGDIYKKNYKIKYCVGCELEKTESDLVDGRCPEHPDKDLEIIEEENYFFCFSKYEGKLLELYEQNPDFVLPQTRMNEVREFVKRGLQDFSVSRLKEKMPWGVEVPGDSEHIMYVWFDALVNYIDAIGWSDDMESFNRWWPVTQYAGKDNTRQQAAMWQAMLLSAGLPHSRQIIIDGFINIGGQKMSKSLGNVVSPAQLVSEYSTDALRYFVAREVSTFEDGDFTLDRFREAYNASLANGIGNLTSRIMKLAETHLEVSAYSGHGLLCAGVSENLDNFEIKKAADEIWKEIGLMDLSIQETKPFSVVKENKEEGIKLIADLVSRLEMVANSLALFMPKTGEDIIKLIQENKAPAKPLFLRKD